jgi:hypothetical protein
MNTDARLPAIPSGMALGVQLRIDLPVGVRTMDRQQLVDQIAAIDSLISELRERNRPIEREIALGHADRVPEHERLKCAEHRDQVRGLVEQKRALRIQISDIKSRPQ